MSTTHCFFGKETVKNLICAFLSMNKSSFNQQKGDATPLIKTLRVLESSSTSSAFRAPTGRKHSTSSPRRMTTFHPPNLFFFTRLKNRKETARVKNDPTAAPTTAAAACWTIHDMFFLVVYPGATWPTSLIIYFWMLPGEGSISIEFYSDDMERRPSFPYL